MPAESDREILRMLLAALEDEASNARFWRPQALTELDGSLTEKMLLPAKRERVRQEMIQHLRRGDVVNWIQGDEDRLWEFRMVVMQKKLYAKVALDAHDPEAPAVEIVSFHEGWR